MFELIDKYLLYRVQIKRDPEAFVKIYDRYVESIYRFVVLKLPRQEDAQDITAEVFTRFWQYVQQQKTVKNVRAFLYKIARNLVVDFYRHQKETTELEIVTFSEERTSSIIDSDQNSSLAEIEAKTELALVLDQLDKLKEDYRDVLALRLIDGLAFADIANILDKKVNTVRVIYHRGIKAIQEFKK